jgi:hypothetical protein
MKRLATRSACTLAGIAALALIATPAFAHGPSQGGNGMGMMGPGMMMGQSHVDDDDAPQAPAPGYGMGPGVMAQGYGYGPGMMGPRMMGPGYGYGPGMMMGPGMGYGMGYGMGPGMHGMMHNMMHGRGMGYGYGPGMGMGYGGMPCWQQGAATGEDLTPDDVKARMERWLAMQGNDRLKLGRIEAVDDDTITVEIVTVDDSLVRKLEVDRHNGWTRPAK